MTRRAWARRHGSTAALLVVAVALAAGVWVDRDQQPDDSQLADRERLIAALDPDQVDRLTVHRGDQVLELRREAGADGGTASWRLQLDGVAEPADQQSVSQLLTTLQLARSDRPVDGAGVDPELLGFGHPEIRFELGQQGRRYQLDIGANVPSSVGGRYAKTSDASAGAAPSEPERIVVVSRELVQSLDEATGALRARRLLPVGAEPIVGLSVVNADGSQRWTLEQVPAWGRGATGYRLSAPGIAAGVRADWRTVEALLGALRGLEVDSFLPVGAVDAGSDEPIHVKVQMAGPEESAELSIGGPCAGTTGRVVRRSAPSPLGGCVAADRLVALNVPAERLADRHVVGASESFVVEVKVSRGQQAVEVARRGNGWIMRSPHEGLADSTAVDGWLAALLALSGEIVEPVGGATELARLGFDDAQVTGRIVSVGGSGTTPEGGERIERIELGATDGESVYLRRLEDGAVLRLDRRAARALEPNARPLRELTVLDFPARRVAGVDADAAPVVQRIDRSADGATWQLVEPKSAGLAADPTLVGDVVQRLTKLQAVQWLDDEPTARTGLDQPWCVVELRLAGATDRTPVGSADDGDGELLRDQEQTPAADDKGPVRLRFGAETTGGYFAQANVEPTLFVAPKSAAQLACGWLLDRGALLVDARTVTKVTLRTPGGGPPIIVLPAADRWVAARGDQQLPRGGAVVRESLEGLFAEAVVGVGAATAHEQLDRAQLEIAVELRSAMGEATAVRLRVGAGDAWRATSVFYVRRDDVQATYVVAQARLRPLLDLF